MFAEKCKIWLLHDYYYSSLMTNTWQSSVKD